MRAKVGDRYVMEELTKRGWLFGGESSGHIIALDRQSTGDGIVSALQVLAAVRDTGKTLAELLAGLELMPQVLINKRIEKGYDWKGNAAFVAAVAEGRENARGGARARADPPLRHGTSAPDHGGDGG